MNKRVQSPLPTSPGTGLRSVGIDKEVAASGQQPGGIRHAATGNTGLGKVAKPGIGAAIGKPGNDGAPLEVDAGTTQSLSAGDQAAVSFTLPYWMPILGFQVTVTVSDEAGHSANDEPPALALGGDINLPPDIDADIDKQIAALSRGLLDGSAGSRGVMGPAPAG